MNDKLTPLREQIDAIDAQILDLLNQRAKVAQQVGHVKAETNAPVFRPEREAQVIQLYYVEELNLEEIGHVLGVGAARVCQIKASAHARLKKALAKAV